MKYLITRTTKNGVEFKRYKCIEGWSKSPQGCRRFSKAGAEKIAKTLNEQYDYEGQSYPKKVHFNILEVSEEGQGCIRAD